MKLSRHLIANLNLATLGLLDSGYLTYEHYQPETVANCQVSWLGKWADCQQVLTSQYAQIGPVPLAALGLAYYLTTWLFNFWLLNQTSPSRWALKLLLALATSGLLASVYFVYLQIVVIQAICLFCMASALLSTLLFVNTLWAVKPHLHA